MLFDENKKLTAENEKVTGRPHGHPGEAAAFHLGLLEAWCLFYTFWYSDAATHVVF